MYQVGDLVYYGGTGACEITGVAEQVFPGESKGQLYYTMKPLHQDCVIHIPVNNDRVFMRPIISKDEAERLIDTIPSVLAEPNHSKVNSQLSEYYKASLETHDCADLIKLTKSLYAKRQEVTDQKRKFSSVEERFMKRAEEMLFSELSAALGISFNDVPQYIASRINDPHEQQNEGYRWESGSLH